MERNQINQNHTEKETCTCPLCGGVLGTVSRVAYNERWDRAYAKECVKHNVPPGGSEHGRLYFAGSYLMSKPWGLIKWELLHPYPGIYQDKYTIQLERRVNALEVALAEKGGKV